MKFLRILKYILAIVAIGLLFVNWKIAIAVFILASVIHTIPLGPNVLLNTITGYLIIGGVISFFFDWRLAIILIVAGLLVAKFHGWGNKQNAEFYGKMLEKIPPTASRDFQEIVNTEIERIEKEGRIKSAYHKFVLQTEGIAVVLWFLRWSNVLPITVQDEIFHDARSHYLSQMKSAGLDEKEIKDIRVEFEEIYKIYDKVAEKENFTKIGTKFAQAISDASKLDFDATEAAIATTLIDRTKEKLEEYREAIKS